MLGALHNKGNETYVTNKVHNETKLSLNLLVEEDFS